MEVSGIRPVGGHRSASEAPGGSSSAQEIQRQGTKSDESYLRTQYGTVIERLDGYLRGWKNDFKLAETPKVFLGAGFMGSQEAPDAAA
jgi:hypothetical protein